MGGRIFHQTHWAPLLQMQGSVAEVKLDLVHRDGRTHADGAERGAARAGDGVIVHEIAAVRGARSRQVRARAAAGAQARRGAARQEQATQQALTRRRPSCDRQQRAAEDRALFAEQMVGIVSHDLRNPLSAIQHERALLGAPSSPADAAHWRSDRITSSTPGAAADRRPARLHRRPDRQRARGHARSRSTCTRWSPTAVDELRAAVPGTRARAPAAAARRLSRRCRPAGPADRQPGGQRHDLRRRRPAGVAVIAHRRRRLRDRGAQRRQADPRRAARRPVRADDARHRRRPGRSVGLGLFIVARSPGRTAARWPFRPPRQTAPASWWRCLALRSTSNHGRRGRVSASSENLVDLHVAAGDPEDLGGHEGIT